MARFRLMIDRQGTGGTDMKGYATGYGYAGYVDGHYMLFASEADYYEYMEDREAA